VAGEDAGVVGKGGEFFADSIEEEFLITAGEIPSSDAAAEEDVAAEEEASLAEVKAEAARTMAGDFEYLEVEPEERE
jgi:hypothetical protein